MLVIISFLLISVKPIIVITQLSPYDGD